MKRRCLNQLDFFFLKTSVRFLRPVNIEWRNLGRSSYMCVCPTHTPRWELCGFLLSGHVTFRLWISDYCCFLCKESLSLSSLCILRNVCLFGKKKVNILCFYSSTFDRDSEELDCRGTAASGIESSLSTYFSIKSSIFADHAPNLSVSNCHPLLTQMTALSHLEQIVGIALIFFLLIYVSLFEFNDEIVFDGCAVLVELENPI